MATALEDAENNPNSQLSQANKRVEELTRELQLDLAQAALDIAGIVDPTPISDGLSEVTSQYWDDFIGAGLSLTSMVPYVGDALAKTSKGTGLSARITKLSKQIIGAIAEVKAAKKSILLTATVANRTAEAVNETKKAIGNRVCASCLSGVEGTAKGENDTDALKNENEKADGYFSEIWESWGEDWEEVKSDVEKTHGYLWEQDIRSTILQQTGNAADLVVDLAGSIISNDKTKELMQGGEEWLEEGYDKLTGTAVWQGATQALSDATDQSKEVIDAWLVQHPDVKQSLEVAVAVHSVAIGAVKELVADGVQAGVDWAKEVAAEYPEATRNLVAGVEIAGVTGAGKVVTMAVKEGSRRVVRLTLGGKNVEVPDSRIPANGQTIEQRINNKGNPPEHVRRDYDEKDSLDQYYYNTETHSYNRIDGGKGAIDAKAILSKDEFTLKDSSTVNARRGGPQEIKVQHDTLSKSQQRRLKLLEEERTLARQNKHAIEASYKNGGGNIDGKLYDRVEDVPEWKRANHDLAKSSEKLGDQATAAVFEQQLPSARRLKSNVPGKGGQGQFDHIYQDGHKVYIIEAKGAGGQRGTRTNKDGKIVQQGTEEYRDAIIENMERKAKDSKDHDLMNTVKALKSARRQGNLEYLEVVQKTDGNKLVPHVQISKYD